MVIIAAQLHYTSTSQGDNILSFPAYRAVQLGAGWSNGSQTGGPRRCWLHPTMEVRWGERWGGQVAGRFSPANSSGSEVMRCAVMLLCGFWM